MELQMRDHSTYCILRLLLTSLFDINNPEICLMRMDLTFNVL